ncbi:isoleucine--tRNA ligase [Alicyclobacillaceae bacterium I2511]|nr:isoleucine--tRNA ligase [Alicyclobacillaceae bacterium I2511]
MVQKVDAKESANTREQRVLTFWKDHDVFMESERIREGRPEFVFYEGPPTANGKPHPGHVLTRIMKDVYLRYRTMKGYHVFRKAGWDTHGLPVEIEVEKKFGISGKNQIQKFGVEKFIQACRESVFTYEKTWRELTERLGYWVDLDNPYMTLTDDYIESVWNLLKLIYDKGLLYQGHRVSPYCPHCETTLSSHEVAQGYKDVKDLTVTAKFRVTLPTPQTPTFILAWTTTPWTLLSNVALAVNPDLTYVRIHSAAHQEDYWVTEGLKDHFLHEGDWVVESQPGTHLLGWTYAPLFPYVTLAGSKHIVVPSGHVTADSGTGIVHMSPAHGEDDYRVCRENGIVFVNFVDETGHFTVDVKDFAGRFVRDESTNVDIVKVLAKSNLVYEKFRQEHAYPHCWRCDTPLLYYAIDSWFIRTTAVKDLMLENSNQVHWIPDHIREGRMGNFLENLVDWNLSRSRYWGTPLPIWVCDTCGKQQFIGSKAELMEKAGRLPTELHKPYIDDITFACNCGGTLHRVPEVIDVWFDSGSMPFAQLHYPFEHNQEFQKLYPADYITEAIDQTRGWFYSLLAISTLVQGRAPYKTVLVLGHVMDEEGKKMSKSKGNVIDPFEAFDKHGADALRYYFLSNTQPWNSQRFYHKAVSEAKSKFVDLLQNVHAFYALYGEIDHFNPQDHHVPVNERPLMDRWILARLNDTLAKADAAYERYDGTGAARLVQSLLDDLSTWYIRRNRDRFWASGMEQDKAAAFLTLSEVLKGVSLMIAPITPFLAEDLYQNTVRPGQPNAPVSVHLCDFPGVDQALIDNTLLMEMDEVLHAVEMGRYLRNESKMKTRQPLSTLYLSLENEAVLRKFVDVIADELNVKAVRFVALDEVAAPQLYLNLAAVGKDYGKQVPRLNKAAKQATPEQIQSFRERGEVFLEGQRIGKEHAELHYQPRFQGLVSVDNRGFVGLDTELTPELVEEGFVREMVSKMQMMRKEVNYHVMDRVAFNVQGDGDLLMVLRRHQESIIKTVLVRQFTFDPVDVAKLRGDLTKDWDVNGKPLTLTVQA